MWKGWESSYFVCDEILLKSLQPSLISIIIVIVILLQINAYYDGYNIWNDWTQDSEVETPVYQEHQYLENVFRTYMNTFSNLCYVFVGFISIFCGYYDSKLSTLSNYSSNYISRYPMASYLLGLGCIHLGIGSGLYHASLTRWGRQLDVAAMYSPLMVLIAMCIGRWSKEDEFKLPYSITLSIWHMYGIIITICAYLFFAFKWYVHSHLQFISITQYYYNSILYILVYVIMSI